MKKWSLAIVIMLAFTFLVGCGQNKYAAQAINEDVDVCAVCNMQVKDDAFATQIVTKDGKSLKFDDLGCMNTWKQENGTDNIGMDYVRDYNDKEWVEFSKATYVYDASIRTPMAYGIVSFKDKSAAEAFIKEQGVGQILTANELANHTWQQSQDMMHHDHGEAHGHDESHSDEHTDDHSVEHGQEHSDSHDDSSHP
ncbi:nitrous oxide reductase accessory protein NosL [Paenibacillus woosongensis]|uniref:Nitrous oxide reductase accessory protein NosL n=1 Tax=Paenibacillus woosongensis TaxID=307580 RepID=A0AA95L2K8_9BACL|nr:nitrous oxide reductase accessory protein NosL [Paenibacillus woosongensis]WHX50696.1 nitrous oxide reductase accessory protein NosL [Paenibacillus woosongensis]